jgi:hypothetical protein
LMTVCAVDLDRVHCQRVVSQIAEAMTAATASGCEISVRCEPPRNVVTRARARRAMASCEAGVMILSPVLIKNQDGIVFQAAVREGVMNAAVDAPR